jgi:hypothetical protein
MLAGREAVPEPGRARTVACHPCPMPDTMGGRGDLPDTNVTTREVESVEGARLGSHTTTEPCQKGEVGDRAQRKVQTHHSARSAPFHGPELSQHAHCHDAGEQVDPKEDSTVLSCDTHTVPRRPADTCFL